MNSEIFNCLLALTKSSLFLKPQELPFYQSTFTSFDQQITTQQSLILQLINNILSHTQINHTPFTSIHQVLDNYHIISDCVDSLLEKSDIQLDLISGKNITPAIPFHASSQNHTQSTQAILRPQLLFEKIDNSNSPFIPIIKYKPNASRPLDYGYSDDISAEMSLHLKTMAQKHFPHPYEYEILNIQYPNSLFQVKPEILYLPMTHTPFTWVDTEDKLIHLSELLNSVQEIAIDTEHHDFRTFQGFTCLIQISTRSHDYIIDALALRKHLHLLNSSFTDPKIIKVLHGAEMDIQWLQRDFGVYIVNLFDTYHASHVLELEAHGLAFLLRYFCDVETNKKFQLSDWRIRPIPIDMLNYARSDTHYLLYIYDRMRNEIILKSNPETFNLMHACLSRSAETSSKLYYKDIYDFENGKGPGGWLATMRKSDRPMSVEQFAVFRGIHAWRDKTARDSDESIRYVLPNHMLFNIVDVMPSNAQMVLGCCNPIPPLVRLYAKELAEIVENCRMESLRNQQLKQAEYEKIKADLKAKDLEWEEKKRLGPVHIKFDSETQETTKSIKRSTKVPTVPKPKINIQNTISVKRNVSSIQINLIDNSQLFGKCLDPQPKYSKWENTQKVLSKMDKQFSDAYINLSNSKIVSDSIDNDCEIVSMESPIIIDAETEDSVAVVDLSVSDSQQMPSEIFTIDDESVEVVTQIRKKGKKKKKRAASEDSALVSTPSPKKQKKKQNQTMSTPAQPFDYNAVKSSVSKRLSELSGHK